MRRMTAMLASLATALLPAGLSAKATTPRRRRLEVRKPPQSNNAEILAWNQAVERRKAEKKARSAGAKQRKNA